MDSGFADETLFYPERRSGTFFHIGLILVLLGAGALGLYGVTRAQIGPVFLAYLLPVLLALVLVPVLSYQLYALWSAYYALGRDGLQLRWGLRNEFIPVTNITGIGVVEDLTSRPPGPYWRLPGAIVGVRGLPGAKQPGEPTVVEYLAASSQGLVFISTRARLYAITPPEPAEFIYTFNRLMELGSLTPLPARSVYPSILIYRLWTNLSVRYLLLGSAVLSLALLVWVGLAVPGRTEIHLGFETTGAPGDLVPAVRLLLLPVLNGMIVLVDWLAGLVLFRRDQTQELAYLVWGSAVVIPILFMVGTYFILRSG